MKDLFYNQNIEKLVKKFGTPFFLFSEKTLVSNYTNLVASFTSQYKKVRADYSVKTNNEIGVLKALNEKGAKFEVVSGFEIDLCRKAGIKPSNITFDGPYKTDGEIEMAVKLGIHAFYADSHTEFSRVNKIAKKLGKTVNIGLRVNLGMKSYLEGPAETYITKFGEDYKQVPGYLYEAAKLENINIIAISTHIGSQILNPDFYLRATEKMVKLASVLVKRGIGIKEICLGGGFPSQTLVKNTLPRLVLSQLGVKFKDKTLPIKVYGNKIASQFKSDLKKFQLPNLTLVVQPGRSVSSSMGIAVAKAVVVKPGWVFLDISTSSLPESIFFAQRKVLKLKNLGPKYKYNIAGKGLNSSDNFVFNENYSKVHVGDIFVILDAGAYSISRANRFTTLNPAVYMIQSSNNITKIRRNENFKDVLGPMEFR